MNDELLKELSLRLRESEFSFIERGIKHITGIYEAVQNQYPNLCDDAYRCCDHCQSSATQGEWKHRVRSVLHSFNIRESRVKRTENRGYWEFT